MLVSDVIPPLLLSREMTICNSRLTGHFFTFFQASFSIRLFCGLIFYAFEGNFCHCIWSLAVKIQIGQYNCMFHWTFIFHCKPRLKFVSNKFINSCFCGVLLKNFLNWKSLTFFSK